MSGDVAVWSLRGPMPQEAAGEGEGGAIFGSLPVDCTPIVPQFFWGTP